MLDKESLSLLSEALVRLDSGFSQLPEYQPNPDIAAMREVLSLVADKMQDNYPYHHPFYIGQMLKPPHPVARLAYSLAMFINPNNHALDGGRASSAMEKEVVAKLAELLGWTAHLGHLAGGGTMANMEALWISGKLHPDKAIAASSQAHYTHSRLTEVLHIPYVSVPTDKRSRMDMNALREICQRQPIGTVVATMGTTATGAVDPLPELLELQKEFGFRIHADAAYGGYFMLANNLDKEARAAFDALPQVDSFVLDPHKHGLQPYGCGCVIFKDSSVGRFYKHDSPYTYFSSDELHLGEISLECSRAGASAVALWATMELLPLSKTGEFAQNLGKGRDAALELYRRLQADSRFCVAFEPQLDIVIWAVKAKTSSEASALAQAIFDRAAEENLHLALTKQPRSLLESYFAGMEWDSDTVTCLRSCLMKPEHLEWMPQIYVALDKATSAVLS
jgi:tyrosine decarboxylase / aspartate 1-decarboxylase